MELEKSKGLEFWDSNPIGGRWSSCAAEVLWALGTEARVDKLLTEGFPGGTRALDVSRRVCLDIPPTARHFAAVGLESSAASLEKGSAGFAGRGLGNAHARRFNFLPRFLRVSTLRTWFASYDRAPAITLGFCLVAGADQVANPSLRHAGE